MGNEHISSRASIISIGGRLKSAREGRSLTLDQVQKQTRIHAQILAALEEGRSEDLLNPTYVKSFLKKYSDFLGLDSSDIIREYSVYRQERAAVQAQTVTLAPVRTEKRESDLIPRIVSIVIIVTVIAAFIWSVIFIATRVASSVKKGKVNKTAVSRSVKGRSQTSSRASGPVTNVKRKESTTRYLGARGMLIYLVVKVKQPVFVKVKKDGTALFERVLPKGSIESFKASEKIELYIAKAEAIELILNGKSLGSPGKGIIKNLEITRKGIRIR